MKHLKDAHEAMEHLGDFVKVSNNNVVFTIQDGPINEAGINGCQAEDMLNFCQHLFSSLNDKFPCEENERTIFHIKEALRAQTDRNIDRIKRGVEGNNLR